MSLVSLPIWGRQQKFAAAMTATLFCGLSACGPTSNGSTDSQTTSPPSIVESPIYLPFPNGFGAFAAAPAAPTDPADSQPIPPREWPPLCDLVSDIPEGWQENLEARKYAQPGNLISLKRELLRKDDEICDVPADLSWIWVGVIQYSDDLYRKDHFTYLKNARHFAESGAHGKIGIDYGQSKFSGIDFVVYLFSDMVNVVSYGHPLYCRGRGTRTDPYPEDGSIICYYFDERNNRLLKVGIKQKCARALGGALDQAVKLYTSMKFECRKQGG